MQNQTSTSRRLGRHTHLAMALGLALGLGSVGALATSAQSARAAQAHIDAYSALTPGAVIGQTTTPPKVTSVHTTGSSSNSTASTITVSNCNDSGSGSLRAAVGFASDGDTIDMSGLACTVHLNSSIVTGVDNLTINGNLSSKYVPQTTLDANDASQVLVHTGAGTLTLNAMIIQHGAHSTNSAYTVGGCLVSTGSISLTDSEVKYCSAENTANGIPRGGAVFARNSVTMDHSLVRYGTAKTSGSGDAQGGGIWSDEVILTNGSMVLDNTSQTLGGGDSLGGGIYAAGKLSVLGGSEVSDNTAEASGTAKGGGIWNTGRLTLTDATVSGNTASGTGTGDDAVGGGIFSDASITVIIGSTTISNNTASAGVDGTGMGGGLYITGPALIGSQTSFTANLASTSSGQASGGGISSGGTLVLLDTSVSNNTASATSSSSGQAKGGGIHMFGGTLDTTNVTIADNTANANNGFSGGGGVYTTDSINIKATTISGNKAKVVGGLDAAQFFLGGSASMHISQSTISGNESSDSKLGAGVYVGHDGTIANSTIAKNIEKNSGNSKFGAGLAIRSGTTVNLSSTIISGNELHWGDGTIEPSDVGTANSASGASLTGDHNFITTSRIVVPGDTIGNMMQAGFEPLADNGGPTKTHALKSWSQAIDAGTANGHATDQRGDGFLRVAGPYADIGAFEVGGNDIIFANGFETP